MKKALIIVALVFMFLLTGCTSNNIQVISMRDLEAKVKEKNNFILFIGENNALEDTLNKVLEENNLTAHKLEVDDLTTNELNKLKTLVSYENPSIVFMINGTDPSILSHVTNENISEKEIINRLKDMEFIK